MSLNLATRKTERASQDAERLRLENDRREAEGKPAFATFEDMTKTESKNPDAGPDQIILDRATQVMADIIAGTEPDEANSTLAQRTSKPDAVQAEANAK